MGNVLHGRVREGLQKVWVTVEISRDPPRMASAKHAVTVWKLSKASAWYSRAMFHMGKWTGNSRGVRLSRGPIAGGTIAARSAAIVRMRPAQRQRRRLPKPCCRIEQQRRPVAAVFRQKCGSVEGSYQWPTLSRRPMSKWKDGMEVEKTWGWHTSQGGVGRVF